MSKEGYSMQRSVLQPPRRLTMAAARWIALAGQAGALVAATFLYGYQIPLSLCALVLGVSALASFALTLADGPERSFSEARAMEILLIDLAALTALLFLTGGLDNPFALFILAPPSVAAANLSRLGAAAVIGSALAATLFLYLQHWPLIGPTGVAESRSGPLNLASWVGLTLALIFLPLYVRRTALDAMDMSTALSAAQMALEEERRVSAMGALAAAAAHELGTPLATVKLAAAELQQELSDRPDLIEDAVLIQQQAERCRQILTRLSSAKGPEDALTRFAPIVSVLAEAAEPHRARRAEIRYRVDGLPADPDSMTTPQPNIVRRPELIHGLRNLIQNAADFAASTVWIDVETSPEAITVLIRDDGAGFSDEILGRLGEPFATTRGRGGGARDAYEGMGLGVFIARTLLERTGAKLSFYNADREASADSGAPGVAGASPRARRGAVVRVRWPRQTLVAPATTLLERQERGDASPERTG